MGYKMIHNIILPIKILEYNTDTGLIEFVDQVTNYQSLRFVSDWEGVGSFTIEMNADKEKSAAFVVGRIIQLANDTSRQGIILKIGRKLEVSDNGMVSNTIIISGIQLKGLLAFTLTVPPGGLFPIANLFDETNATADSYVDYTDGVIKAQGGSFAAVAMPVKPNTSYYKTDLKEVSWYDVTGTTFLGGDSSAINGVVISPPDAYFAQSYGDTVNIGTAQFEVGEVQHAWVEWGTANLWQDTDADGELVDIAILDYWGTGISYDIYEDQYTETIMRDLVFNNRKVNVLPFQNLEYLTFESAPVTPKGIIHTYESFRFKKLSDVLEYLSQASGLGWNIVAEDGGLVFKVLEGSNRSSEQSVNNPVIFSFYRGNVKRIEYSEDTLEMNNQIIVGGQGEGTDRDLLVLGNFQETGVWSQLGFIDARDVETQDGLETRGLAKIVERKRKQAIMVTGFTKKILVQLGTDYEIGDKVTIKVEEWNLTLHVRVTAITERQTLNNAGTLEFEFGTKALSLESLIRENFDNVKGEVLK